MSMKKTVWMTSLLLAGTLFVGSREVKAEGNLNATIDVPGSYVCQDTKIPITIPEQEGLTIKNVKYKVNDGEYKDITSKQYFQVNDNCSVTVSITYSDATKEEKSENLTCEIANFDGVKPELSAGIKGELLTVTGTDDLSGIASITINEKEYADLTDGAISINLKELENSDEYVRLVANDQAGNHSAVYKVKNPYFVGDEKQGQTDKSVNNPASTDATKETMAKATVIDYKTGSSDGNEFYTIQTDSNKIFYLVVDKSSMAENVYLLTEVGENDLLNFVNYDGNNVENGNVNMYTIAEEKKAEVEEVTEAKPKSSSNNTYIILIGAALVGGAYYYKVKGKGKTEGKDQDQSEEKVPL